MPSAWSSACSRRTGATRRTQIDLPERDGDVWHGYVAGLRPGQITAIAPTGPIAPHSGHRFNPNKLLIDPYAKRLTGAPALARRADGLRRGDTRTPTCPSTSATAPPTCRTRSWSIRRSPGATTVRPRTPIDDTHHLRGAREGPDQDASRRATSAGTFLALASDPVLDHLTDARRDGDRAAAGPGLHRRPLPGREGADELLGLPDDRLLRARAALHVTPARSPSSSRWSRASTPPGSR